MKRWLIILALLIYWTFCANIINSAAQSDSAIVTINDLIHNGTFDFGVGEAVYNTMRDKAAAGMITTTHLEVGQLFGGAVYIVRKAALTLPFYLASIPITATIDSVFLDFYGETDLSTTDFFWAGYSFPFFADLDVNDYDEWIGRQVAGAAHTGIRMTDSVSSLNFAIGAYGNVLKFISKAVDSVQIHFLDSLQFILISREDVTASPPGDSERLRFDIDGANPPKLIIYWTAIAGDILTGARGTVLREATGNELESHRRKQKYINKVYKKQ